MSLSSTPRRSVLKASAWALPAVVVATASPAFAGSGNGTLIFLPGWTRLVAAGWYDFVFERAGIRAEGTSGPAQVTLTVTFTPRNVDPADDLWLGTPMPGWPSTAAVQTATSTLVFVSSLQVSPGSTVALPDGFHFGSFRNGVRGVFALIFSAPGYESETVTFDTDLAQNPRAMSPSGTESARNRLGSP